MSTPRDRVRSSREHVARCCARCCGRAGGGGAAGHQRLSQRLQRPPAATGAYYFAVLAGLTVLAGLSGQISLGHGALMAVGAYTVALLIGNEGWAVLPALAAAALVTAAGRGPGRRRRAAGCAGPYLAGATLAFAVGLPALADKFPKHVRRRERADDQPADPTVVAGRELPARALGGLDRVRGRWSCCSCSTTCPQRHRPLDARRPRRRDRGLAQRAARRPHADARVHLSAACAGLGGGLLAVVLQLAQRRARSRFSCRFRC